MYKCKCIAGEALMDEDEIREMNAQKLENAPQLTEGQRRMFEAQGQTVSDTPKKSKWNA